MTFQTVPVPLSSPLYRNVDESVLSDDCAYFIDGYRDEKGNTIRRPGLSSWIDLGIGAGHAIDGAFWWETKKCIIAVCAGRIFRINYLLNVVSKIELTGAGTLTPGTRCTFTSDGTYCFIANGGQIVYTAGVAGDSAVIADVDAPIQVTHVSYIDGYLIANSSDNKWWWSDPGDSLTWNALNFASAAGDPDFITALIVQRHEIYLMGPNSIEIWQNDGQNPFSRIDGGYEEKGQMGPHAVIATADGVYWLSNKMQISRFDGRTSSAIQGKAFTEVSGEIDRELQDFTPDITDVIGDWIEMAGQSFLVFNMPSANRTFVCNIQDVQNPEWSEWGHWNSAIGNYDRWIGNCHCFSPEWKLHVVGHNNLSLLMLMSSTSYDDLGAPIRLSKRTGHIDFGTTKRKRGGDLRIKLKRGQGLSTRTPNLMIRWRDDGRRWSNERLISLGNSGEYDNVRQIPCRGNFRTRQYEVTVTDAVSAIVGQAEHDLEVLR